MVAVIFLLVITLFLVLQCARKKDRRQRKCENPGKRTWYFSLVVQQHRPLSNSDNHMGKPLLLLPVNAHAACILMMCILMIEAQYLWEWKTHEQLELACRQLRFNIDRYYRFALHVTEYMCYGKSNYQQHTSITQIEHKQKIRTTYMFALRALTCPFVILLRSA